MPVTNKGLLRDLRRVYDPAALCRGLARVLVEQGAPCDHTFRYSRAYFAHYAPDIDADAYLARLDAAGLHCDCEVGFNLCADLGV
jgi:hypothetical protein